MMMWIATVWIALVFAPQGCRGLAMNKKPKNTLPWTSFLQPFQQQPSRSLTSTPEDGRALLQALNMTSNTEPKRFQASPLWLLSIFTAIFPALFRFGSGTFVDGYQIDIVHRDDSQYHVLNVNEENMVIESGNRFRSRPAEPLILYEFEGCPFCRKVREAVSILSLPVTFRPCPREGRIYRPEIKSTYGEKAKFPYLIDPNNGVKMFESQAIIEYLFKVYGNGKIPWTLADSNWVTLTAGLGMLSRGTAGISYRPSSFGKRQPLLLYSYEGSPFCKVVRERLCELEISHTQISCPRGSSNRQRLLELTGRFQVPYLEDVNTGVQLFESEAICEYLEKQYAVAPSPVDYI